MNSNSTNKEMTIKDKMKALSYLPRFLYLDCKSTLLWLRAVIHISTHKNDYVFGVPKIEWRGMPLTRKLFNEMKGGY